MRVQVPPWLLVSRVAERQTRWSQKPLPARREGSSPSSARPTPGSSNGRMAVSESVDVGSTPAPGTACPGSEKESWLSSKEQIQVRLLAGVLGHPRSVTEARDRAKVEDEVRFLTGIVNQPAKLKRPSTALVRRRLWVRLPPLALWNRMWESRAIRQPWALENVGSNPTILTAEEGRGQLTRTCSWESSRFPKPAEWVRILPFLLVALGRWRCWRPDCRSGEAGSTPVQGARESMKEEG